MKGKELQGRLSRVMKVEVDMATIFCVECGECEKAWEEWK